jgi:two-component system, LytTR family, response regulator
MKIKCMVVDDQIESTELLADHIKNISSFDLKYVTTNPIEALSLLERDKIDCIYLDIEMPQMSGLEFIDAMKESIARPIPRIILITAYDQYAVSGYDYGVFDYLLKPVSYKRFKISAERILASFNSNEIPREFLFLDIDGKKVRLNFAEIMMVEGAGNYIIIWTVNKKLICYKTMSSILELLPSSKFLRVHKSFIISIACIDSIRGNEVFIRINGAVKNIPIGVTYKNSLLEFLQIND